MDQLQAVAVSIQKWWVRRGAAIKGLLTLLLSLISGGLTSKIEGIHHTLMNAIASNVRVAMKDGALVGDWHGQQFWPVHNSSDGELKIAASPPCIDKSVNCYFVVTATPLPGFAWAVGTTVFTALFVVVYGALANRFLGPYKSLKGKSLTVRIRLDSQTGAAEEEWQFDGVVSENQRYKILCEYGETSDHKPKITELTVTADRGWIRPNFLSGVSRYRGDINFAEHVQPPFTFSVSHKVENAWARDAADFKARHGESLLSDEPLTDYWDYEAPHHWREFTCEFLGLDGLCRNEPYVVVQKPGAKEVRIADPAIWSKTNGGSGTCWKLRLSDVEAQTNVSVRWELKLPAKSLSAAPVAATASSAGSGPSASVHDAQKAN